MKKIVNEGKLIAVNVTEEQFLRLAMLWDVKDIPWYSFGDTVFMSYRHGDLRVFEAA
jgi:hypothetical protein